MGLGAATCVACVLQFGRGVENGLVLGLVVLAALQLLLGLGAITVALVVYSLTAGLILGLELVL